MTRSTPWPRRRRKHWESQWLSSSAGRFAVCSRLPEKQSGCDTRDWSNREIRFLASQSMRSFMAPKTESYVDTSALIAFLDRSDSYHPLFRRLFSSPPQLVTSALVVAEGHGWFLRRYDQNRAIQFLNFIDDLPVLAIQVFDGEALRKTSRIVKKFSDQLLTLADA